MGKETPTTSDSPIKPPQLGYVVLPWRTLLGVIMDQLRLGQIDDMELIRLHNAIKGANDAYRNEWRIENERKESTTKAITGESEAPHSKARPVNVTAQRRRAGDLHIYLTYGNKRPESFGSRVTAIEAGPIDRAKRWAQENHTLARVLDEYIEYGHFGSSTT